MSYVGIRFWGLMKKIEDFLKVFFGFKLLYGFLKRLEIKWKSSERIKYVKYVLIDV